MENTYEEVVLQTVMKDILQGEQGKCSPEGGGWHRQGTKRNLRFSPKASVKPHW